ncbi:hypothetical protein [Actinomadura geliboluensis]|uniref:hypothetical protein n=1 Tax=Actinomadura geliboluensis TaxID=882440 RepID=UPI003722AE38
MGKARTEPVDADDDAMVRPHPQPRACGPISPLSPDATARVPSRGGRPGTGGAVSVAAATTGLLAAAGLLPGPTLVGPGSALAESMIAAFLGAAPGLWSAGRSPLRRGGRQ